MPIETVPLPQRGKSATHRIADDVLDEVHEYLNSADFPDGEAVVVGTVGADGKKPFTKDSDARNFARVFADAYQTRFREEADVDDDGTPYRLLSTHAIPAKRNSAGKVMAYLAAVSINTREPGTRSMVEDGPSRSDLYKRAREWRKAHPHDRTFRNYTKWDYDRLRATVNRVTGYNDGVFTPEPENGNAPVTPDATPDNSNDDAGTVDETVTTSAA